MSETSSSPALSRAIFIMWTKKGNLSPGTEKTILSCWSCRAAAGVLARGMPARRLNSRATPSSRQTVRCPPIVTSSANGGSRGAQIAGRVLQVLRAINLDTTRVVGSYPWGAIAPCTTPSDRIDRATRLRALASFLLDRHRSHRASRWDDWLQSTGAAPAPREGHKHDIERAGALYPRRR